MSQADDGGGRPDGRPLSFRAVPAAIVVVALVIRLVAIAVDDGYEPRQDAFDYDRHARSIAAGAGFPGSNYVPDGGASALRAPGYPYAIGLVYAITGGSIDAGRALGAGLGALTVLLLYLLTRRIWGPRIAAPAAGMAAVFPPLVNLSTELYSENLFIPLLLGAAIAVLHFRESAAIRWAVLAGALAGIAALTRGPGVVALLPLIYGLWMIRPAFSRQAMIGPAVGIVCAVLVIAPWTVRNAVEFGRLVPIATSTGFGLAGTYNQESLDDPAATAAWRNPAIVPEYGPLFNVSGVDEATLDATLRRESLSFATDHPAYVGEVFVNNALRLLYLQGGSVVAYGEEIIQPGIGNRGSAVERISFALASVLAALGVFSILSSRRRRRRDLVGRMGEVTAGPTFLWLIPIALIVVALPVAGLPRYRVPADPFLLILSAIGLVWLLDRLGGRVRTTATASALAAVVFLGVGCGGSADTAGTTTRPEPGSTTAGGVSKEAYIERADEICRSAIADARRLVLDRFASGGQGGGSLESTTKDLVGPGIRIRDRQAQELRSLPRPTGETTDLDTFLGLFDPIGELARERLRAGLAGDPNESLRLEQLLAALAVEQQDAARAFGFDDCSKDVIGEAFR